MLDIAAKPQNRSTSGNFLYSVVSCSIVLVPMSPKNIIQFVSDNDNPGNLYSKSVQYSCEVKEKIFGTGRTEPATDKAKT